MKKHAWLIIVIAFVAALLLSFFYPQIKRHRLPQGAPAERPLER